MALESASGGSDQLQDQLATEVSPAARRLAQMKLLPRLVGKSIWKSKQSAIAVDESRRTISATLMVAWKDVC
ncbi:MAG: hypothetical protein R3C11_29355 [Planctomycetaceae bacterium]